MTRQAAHTPTVLDVPTDPGDCCTQRTIKVPAEVDAAIHQKHPWQTGPWRRSYARRNVVEGVAGILKTAGGGNVKRDHLRLMGQAAHTLLMACAVAGANLNLYARWLERSADTDATSKPEPPPKPGSIDAIIASTAAAFARTKDRHDPGRGADPPAG